MENFGASSLKTNPKGVPSLGDLAMHTAKQEAVKLTCGQDVKEAEGSFAKELRGYLEKRRARG